MVNSATFALRNGMDSAQKIAEMMHVLLSQMQNYYNKQKVWYY